MGRKYLGKVSEMSPKCLGKVYSSYLNIGKIKFPRERIIGDRYIDPKE